MGALFYDKSMRSLPRCENPGGNQSVPRCGLGREGDLAALEDGPVPAQEVMSDDDVQACTQNLQTTIKAKFPRNGACKLESLESYPLWPGGLSNDFKLHALGAGAQIPVEAEFPKLVSILGNI